ncbi:SEL1-like repeat protein [Capnocytophaga genosp. AHN8471]|mgnify:CR=1 FL=1|jgi:Sel1 repeat protein|uniref:tetratricopeptide repeat protein n=1 Tax=Capnocytophaga TaxID=1016 RepID=UPI0019313165|nr:MULTISPECIES: tetratricopeptide repeat protein [Capnocytophaga]MBM0656480.1 SEL1-like repeat protein [Capnocytophaga genosp. AHN8471]
MEIVILIIIFLAIGAVLYGFFQSAFDTSESTVLQTTLEKKSPQKSLEETVNQMQSEELLRQSLFLIAQNNYTEALPILEQAANLGNAEAMCTLGKLYAEGKGVDNNIQKSYEYYSLAAQKEHPQAQYQLGMCFLAGKGVSSDVQQAQQWIEKAAQNDYPEALEILKRMGIEVTPIQKTETTTSKETIKHTKKRGVLSNVFVSTFLLGITLWIVFFVFGLIVFKSQFSEQNIKLQSSYFAFIISIFGMILGFICILIAYFKPKISSLTYIIILFISTWIPTLLIYFVMNYFSERGRTEEFWGITFTYVIALIVIGIFIKLSKSKKPIINF